EQEGDARLAAWRADAATGQETGVAAIAGGREKLRFARGSGSRGRDSFADGYDGGSGAGRGLLKAREHLGTHVFDEGLHLAVHLFHALAHLQDDGDAGDVDAEVAGEVENELEPLQIFIGVEAGVALGARRLEQTL